jgi:hypothetical protein
VVAGDEAITFSSAGEGTFEAISGRENETGDKDWCETIENTFSAGLGAAFPGIPLSSPSLFKNLRGIPGSKSSWSPDAIPSISP